MKIKSCTGRLNKRTSKDGGELDSTGPRLDEEGRDRMDRRVRQELRREEENRKGEGRMGKKKGEGKRQNK